MRRARHVLLLASALTGVGASAPKLRAQTIAYAGAHAGNDLVASDDVTYGAQAAQQVSLQQTGVTGAAAAPALSPSAGADYTADGEQSMPVAAGADQSMSAAAGDQSLPASAGGQPRRNALDRTMGNGPPLTVKPYIEAGQVAYAPLSPGGDVLTYSDLAVGVDAQVNGNNNQGTVSLRYEHQFGWGTQGDVNILSGLAQMGTAIVPGTLRLDYGAFATRAYVGAFGAAVPAGSGSLMQIWSVYGGPTLTTHLGEADVAAHYHIGYASQGWPSDVVTTSATGAQVPGPDAFAHSTVQDAAASLGFKPGQVAPVGLGIDGGWYREDISLLGQRIEDEHVRGSVTVPVTPSLRLVGGLGYEHVEVSSYNALNDASGNPVVGADGLYVADTASPRLIAFDVDDIIWDVGVEWRPSPRTSLEAHYGRRYGSDGAWGSFSWAIDRRQAVNIAVYDNLVGFGGSLTGALEAAPSQFTVVSNPVTGTIGGCVATLQSGGCLAGVLGSVEGVAYRDRGVVGTYGVDLGRLQTGFGLGYDRHEYVVASDTLLGSLNGQVSEYWWLATYLTDRLDRHSSLMGAIDVYRYQAGADLGGDMTALHASGTYSRSFSRHLTGSASLALDGVNLQTPDYAWIASGALDMRYSF